jgi:hypothetical protein
VIGIYLPLALQVLHDVSPLDAGYMTASLAVCWTVASMATAHLHGRAASLSIVIGLIFCCVGLASLAFGIEYVPTPLVPTLNGLVGIGLGCSNLHVVAATMRHAQAGEETLTASSIPTVRSLGIAFGAAGAGVIANGAGLTDALLPADVSRAFFSVLGIALAAPIGALVMGIRFVAKVDRSPVSSDPARTVPDSVAEIH